MDPQLRSRYEVRAAVIKAMGHPTRLFIVEELAQQEQCVRDLTGKIGADVSTVSKHLSVLKNAGIVQDEKRGAQVFYSLLVPCVLNFFSCVESVLERRVADQAKQVQSTS
jgi:ArsR family transcriptional regulator